jgi:hypothetical protein
MATFDRLVIDNAAVGSLLRSPKVAADVQRRAQLIADAANAKTGRSEDHIVDSEIGDKRARSAVLTNTWNARWREARERTLTSSVDAGRA